MLKRRGPVVFAASAQQRGENIRRMWRSLAVATVAVALVGAGALLAGVPETIQASNGGGNHSGRHGGGTRTSSLYELQSAFHAAATLRDPNDLEQRLADMLELWTEDGTLTLGPNTFTGRGEPNTASCAPGSGTLCDFFTNVAPPFQNRWISLSPSYKTEVEEHGRNGTLEFQCLYFDEAWEPMIRLNVDATATRVRGNWRFSSAVVTPIAAPGIPYP